MIKSDAIFERVRSKLIAARAQRQPPPADTPVVRLPDEGDINDAWWGLCADRKPVTLASLAQRLGIAPATMARLAERYRLPVHLLPGVDRCR